MIFRTASGASLLPGDVLQTISEKQGDFEHQTNLATNHLSAISVAYLDYALRGRHCPSPTAPSWQHDERLAAEVIKSREDDLSDDLVHPQDISRKKNIKNDLRLLLVITSHGSNPTNRRNHPWKHSNRYSSIGCRAARIKTYVPSLCGKKVCEGQHKVGLESSTFWTPVTEASRNVVGQGLLQSLASDV